MKFVTKTIRLLLFITISKIIKTIPKQFNEIINRTIDNKFIINEILNKVYNCLSIHVYCIVNKVNDCNLKKFINV